MRTRKILWNFIKGVLYIRIKVMRVDACRNVISRRALPLVFALIPVAALTTSVLEGESSSVAESDSASTKVESLIWPFEQDHKRVAEDAWVKYKKALLQAKDSAFKDANLDLLNSIESELLSPTAAPKDWPSDLLRKECSDYYGTLDNAVKKYLRQIDRLVTEQLRSRDLDAANALDGIRSSFANTSGQRTTQASSGQQIVVDDFEGEALSMDAYAAGAEKGVYPDGSEVAVAQVDAPYSSSNGKSKGLRFDWPSPHGEWIGANYSTKRSPLFSSGELSVRFRLWLNGDPAPSSTEVHFSDQYGEVFTYRIAIPAPDQRGWRWVTVPIDWEKYRIAFGGYPGNGVIDFPVSLHSYAFLFDGEQTPSSWLVIDDVSVTRKKSGTSQ